VRRPIRSIHGRIAQNMRDARANIGESIAAQKADTAAYREKEAAQAAEDQAKVIPWSEVLANPERFNNR
jgi:hypothetical protein